MSPLILLWRNISPHFEIFIFVRYSNEQPGGVLPPPGDETRMLSYGADIRETQLLEQYPDAMRALLRDRTTGRNIMWCTDSYAGRGEGYRYDDTIEVERVTGVNGMVVQPRALKSRGERRGRTRGMAEVFTPSWVCNLQNNVVDSEWFGRPDVFNTQSADGREWEPTPGPIVDFPPGKKWSDYVRSTRMEITCGEAPYLVSRYDTVSGDTIELRRRIGMLDRKLRVVGDNTEGEAQWLAAAEDAYKATLAYEWQGDNLLLAREALLVSFVEYFADKFHGRKPGADWVERIACVISWNVWQMDGLRGVVPGSCHNRVAGEEPQALMEGDCPGCRDGNVRLHNGKRCIIRDWGTPDPETGEEDRKIEFIDLLK